VSYSWSSGDVTSAITTSTGGTYTVTVTDNNSGCASSATINVPVNNTAPTLSLTPGALPCGGGNTTLTASSNSNVAYSWSGPGIVSGANTASAVINQAGIYSVTVTDGANGCSQSGTMSISQTTVTALAAADVTTGAAPLTVNFSSTGSSGGTYSWTTGDGNTYTQPNPSNTYTAPGTYTVVLTTSSGSCSDSDSLLIKVLDAFGPIPEIFTPNGDFKNDEFVIPGLDAYPNAKLQVFNRWGNEVYGANPYKNDWNGTPNAPGKTGSGKLPVGTYFYILELGDTNNTIYRGFVQIQY
jgi:gliding motility-associated-like protein